MEPFDCGSVPEEGRHECGDEICQQTVQSILCRVSQRGHPLRRTRTREVEVQAPVLLLGERAGDLVGPAAQRVVAHVVLEVERLVGDGRADELRHGALVALQHEVEGLEVCVHAEAVGQLEDARAGQLHRRHDGHQVTAVPHRHAHLGRGIERDAKGC